MHQVFNEDPPPLTGLRDGVPASLDALIRRALSKQPGDRQTTWDEFAQDLSGLVARREVPRGRLQGVLDSERFNMLRALEFFSAFGDVELWEVVHRAKWQRFVFGHALYKKGQPGGSFHIMAQGEVEIFRDGRKVASLGQGTSVGEMAYLAPSEELRLHTADVIVSAPCTTISFTPATLGQLSPGTRHRFDDAFIKVLVRRLHAAHEMLDHPRRIL
jgi:CRP-like cAMP-binding protein